MARILFCLCLILHSHAIRAQFSKAQKDSVVKQLGYKQTSYSISVNFNPRGYTISPPNPSEPFIGLSESEILGKLTNSFKDAIPYQYLTLTSYEKKDIAKAEKYFQLAVENYQRWLDQEPNNPEPYIGVLALYYGTQSYSRILTVLEEAVRLFPENIRVLEWAVTVYLNLYKDFPKTQASIDKILSIEPYNLFACANQVAFYQYQFIMAKNEDKPGPELDVSIAEKAFKAKPKEIGYEHLYHSARVQCEFFTIVFSYLEKKEDANINDFATMFKELSKAQVTLFKDAESFFKSQISKQEKGRDNLLNSLGFVTFCLSKYPDSKKYFQSQLDEFKTLSALDALVLISIIEKDWKTAEQLLENSLNQFNDFRSYGTLMNIYDDYDKNESKLLSTVKRMEEISNPDESVFAILATWYIKRNNIEKAVFYCNKLNPESLEWAWRNLAITVLKDESKENAQYFLDKILTKKPSDADALKIKAQLNF